jgi:hypothetical protein
MWPAAPNMLRCLWAQSNNQTKYVKYSFF